MPGQSSVLIVQMMKRRNAAVEVQEVLTGHGCIIKTRLGIHDGVLDRCSDHGLILLELVGPRKERLALERALKALSGVKARHVDLPL